MGFNVRDYFGMRTTVRHVYGAYPLPAGLNEGDEVTLVDFQTGYWHVERDGKRYLVAMAGVGNAGRLPKPNQPVRPACKPRVRVPQGPNFPKQSSNSPRRTYSWGPLRGNMPDGAA
jgi:hypothetical protein